MTILSITIGMRKFTMTLTPMTARDIRKKIDNNWCFTIWRRVKTPIEDFSENLAD
jgi:hypothetical protein